MRRVHRRRRFRVVVHYCEPTYASHSESEARTYRWTYKILAFDPAQAERRARAEFREVERQSSVGWTREIVRVEISEI
jgi:hypothetical protein